jgi:hypothetical protein
MMSFSFLIQSNSGRRYWSIRYKSEFYQQWLFCILGPASGFTIDTRQRVIGRVWHGRKGFFYCVRRGSHSPWLVLCAAIRMGRWTRLSNWDRHMSFRLVCMGWQGRRRLGYRMGLIRRIQVGPLLSIVPRKAFGRLSMHWSSLVI